MKNFVRFFKQKAFALFTLFLFCTNAEAQLFVDTSFTAQEMVMDFFHHPDTCVAISNVTYTGDSEAVGFFDGSASNIGLDAGIMLATGSIFNAIGPNDHTSAGNAFFTPGDSDLEAIIGGSLTTDAAVLEFDLSSTESVIEFRYVFASEEYPEYVGSPFNDAFAFIVTGPGFTGPQNIALVPGGSTPVAINNVNDGINPGFYTNNDGGTTIQYDGFTTVLAAPMNLIPFETYHVKLVVADIGDSLLDSGIFIGVQSLCEIEEVPPTSNFAPEPDGSNNKMFNFDNQAKYATNWAWDFGDGATSNERHPSHTYADNGVYEVTLTATNYCCSSTSSFQVTAGEPVGIATAASEPNVRLYPNPTNGILHLDLPNQSATTIRLFNAVGQLLVEKTATTFTQLDLGAFEKGIYIVETTGANFHHSQQVLHQ